MSRAFFVCVTIRRGQPILHGILIFLTSLGASLYQFSASNAGRGDCAEFWYRHCNHYCRHRSSCVFQPAETRSGGGGGIWLNSSSLRPHGGLDVNWTVPLLNSGIFVERFSNQWSRRSKRCGSKSTGSGPRSWVAWRKMRENPCSRWKPRSQHSGEAIQQLTTTAVAALQNSARELGSQTDRLGESAVRIATSLDEVSSKLSSMQTPERVIEISLEPAVDAFSHAIGELRRENAGQAARQLEMLEGLRAATQSSTEVMPEFSERATEVVRDAAAQLSTSADFLKASDARHAERLEVVLARQLEMLEGLRAATQSSTEVMSEFSERATEVVRDAAAQLSTSASSSRRAMRDMPSIWKPY